MPEKTLKKFLREKTTTLIVPIIMIVFGIISVASPGSAISVIGRTVGIVLLIIGLGYLLWGLKLNLTKNMIVGGFIVLVGVLFVADPINKAMFIIKFVGFCILFYAGISLLSVYSIRKQAADGWVKYAVPDFINLGIGAVLMFMPGDVASIVMIIIGVALIVLGIYNIIIKYNVYKVGKYVEDGDVVWEEEISE